MLRHRPPSTPISGNAGQRRELTPYQRGIIVGETRRGASLREISSDLKVPRSTVSDTILNSTERDEGKSAYRTGRPKTFSDRDKRKIVRLARLHPKWTNKTLKAEAGVKCHTRTITRLLDTFNISKWRAPIHKAKKTMKWFRDQGIPLVEWPPYSPDMNPIEHIWFQLKKLVYEVNPDIDNISGGDDKVREALAQALQEAWERIPRKYFDALWKSMGRRCEAVVQADGWQTKY